MEIASLAAVIRAHTLVSDRTLVCDGPDRRCETNRVEGQPSAAVRAAPVMSGAVSHHYSSSRRVAMILPGFNAEDSLEGTGGRRFKGG